MIVYFDSSSIVKWFFDEAFMEPARDIKDKATSLFTSLISFPEVMVAINRAWREGRCAKPDMELVRDEFMRIWTDFRWIAIDEKLMQRAGHLIFRHNLRGFDAVHMASALLLKEERGNNDIDLFFSSFDKNLNRAAREEGFLIHEGF